MEGQGKSGSLQVDLVISGGFEIFTSRHDSNNRSVKGLLRPPHLLDNQRLSVDNVVVKGSRKEISLLTILQGDWLSLVN